MGSLRSPSVCFRPPPRVVKGEAHPIEEEPGAAPPVPFRVSVPFSPFGLSPLGSRTAESPDNKKRSRSSALPLNVDRSDQVWLTMLVIHEPMKKPSAMPPPAQ